MSNIKKSEVWNYFDKKDTDSAQCKRCSTTIKCKGGSTSAMANHLKNKHLLNIKRTMEESEGKCLPEPKRPKVNTVADYIRRESLGELIAKCAAFDGFSIRGITNSSAIREYITKRGYEMPKSIHSVKKIILDFANIKKKELCDILQKKIANGERFSITCDEWTNIKMKRFLCVTLHTSQAYKLGLIKIHGSCDAKKTEQLIRQKLEEFNLNFQEHIVASTHDGAQVMQKYGKLTGIESQLCYNHAIHLAVLDSLYDKNVICEDNVFEDHENEIEDELQDEFISFDAISYHVETNKLEIYKCLQKCREIVKHFKVSAVKNSVLQTYVKAQEGKELHLRLDCRTRWNSLLPMLDRLIKLEQCVKSALIDTGRDNLYDKNIFSQLKNIVDVLKLLEISINELGKEDATLITSEGVFKFIFNKLKTINNEFSTRLIETLKKRLFERRNKNLITLYKYLLTGSFPKNDGELLYSSKKQEVISLAQSLISRLFTNKNDQEVSNVSNYSENIVDNKSLAEEMQDSISLILSEKCIEDNTANYNLQKEFKLFELTGFKSSNLVNLYNALNSIRPTSTSSERVFSVASNFCTKIRSSMSYETLDALVFLKYYFLNRFQ